MKGIDPDKKDIVAFVINDEADFERWDRFVADSPQSNPFATSHWLKAVSHALDINTDLWVTAGGEEWLAGVPIYYRQRFGRKAAVLPPLTPYNSYLYRPATGSYPSKTTSEHIAITRSLSGAVIKHYSRLSHLLFPTIDDIRPWSWAGWNAIPRYTYHLEPDKDLPVSHAIRKHMKKCDKAGFSISFDWDLEKFWSIYQVTQQRQVFGIGMSRESFFALADTMHENGLAWMASAVSPEGEAAAARIELAIPGTAGIFDWVAGSLPKFLSTGVNPWLMMQIAAKAREEGYRFWDLCGADFEAIARFKSEFGGKLIHYFQISAPQSPVQKAFSIFRRMISGRQRGATG